MRVALLGPSLFDGPDGPLPVTGRLAALIALLALRPGGRVSKPVLAEELYGDKLIGSWDSAMRGYFADINDLVTGVTLLVSERSLYGFADGMVSTDIESFEVLQAHGHQLLVGRRFEEAERALSAACALWRGSVPFDGLTQTRVFESAGQRLRELRATAEDDLADAMLALGRHADIVDTLNGAVAHHPEREIRWRQLMLALYRCRRHREAVAVLPRARMALDEHGLEPSPELRDLDRALHAYSPRLEHRPVGDHATPVVPRSSDRRRVVGRDTIVRSVIDTNGRVVALIGPPGIGRTAVLRAVEDEVRAGGAHAAWIGYGRCDPSDDRPLLAVTRALGLGELAEGLVPRPDTMAARELHAARGPRWLLLDDLQHGDDATLAFVRHAATSPLPDGVHLVVTSTPGDHLRSILDIGTVRRVDVGPLGVEAIDELLGADHPAVASGPAGSIPVRRANRVWEASGGWPLLFDLAIGDLDGPHRDDASSPHTTDLMARVLGRLPTPTRELVELAAVLVGAGADGRDLISALSICTHRRIDEVDAALQHAVAVGLLAGDPPRFRHPVLRDAVDRLLTDARRRLIAATAVSQPSLPATVRACLALRAVPVVSIEDAIGMASTARSAAAALRDHRGVIALGEAQLRVRVGPPDDETRCHLLLDIAEAEEQIGRRTSADARREQALRLAEVRGDFATAARAAGCDPANGRSVVRSSSAGRISRALALAPAAGRRTKAERGTVVLLTAERACLAALTGDETHLALDRAVIDDIVHSPSRSSKAIALEAWLYQSSRPDEAAQRLSRSAQLLELSRRRGCAVTRSEATILRVRALFEHGRLSEAAELVTDEFRGMTEGDGRPGARWLAQLLRSSVATATGASDVAVRAAEAGAEIARECSVSDGDPARVAQRLVFALLGWGDQAAELDLPKLAQGTRFGWGPPSDGETAARAAMRCALAGAELAVGGFHDEAEAALANAESSLARAGDDLFLQAAAALVAEASWLLRRRVDPAVRKVLAPAADLVTVLGLAPTVALGPAARQLALCDALDGSPSAVLALTDALARCAEWGFESWEALTADDLGDELARRGDPGSDELYTRARDLRRRGGLSPF